MNLHNIVSVFRKITSFVNKLPLPNRAWIIFGLALIWWVTDFMIEYKRISTYYQNLLMSGSLPPEADSISIPIFSYVFGDFVLGLMFGCYLLWALWGIKPGNKAINFNKTKPIRSTISWVFTGFWVIAASTIFTDRFLEGNSLLAGLQIISFYCAIATNAAVQNKD